MSEPAKVFRYLTRLLSAATVSALGFGGGFGLLIFIFLVVTGGNKAPFISAVRLALWVGAVFALGLVIVMVVADLSVRLYFAKGFNEAIWELEQTRELELEGSLRQISTACRYALLAVPNVGNVADEPEHLLARASTGASWRSPGEDIEVELNPVTENRWRVRCVSRSRANVVFDYGKNFENVEVWRRQMAKELAGAGGPH